MQSHSRTAALALLSALALTGLSVTAALAHEERDVSGYTIEVGFINEPVFVGDKSGLELGVHKGDQAVEGLDRTLTAEVVVGDKHLALPLAARETEPGWYQSTVHPHAGRARTRSTLGNHRGPGDRRILHLQPRPASTRSRTRPRASSRSSSRRRPT